MNKLVWRFLLAVMIVQVNQTASAQWRTFVTSDRTILGSASNLSASARIADLDHDGDLDVVVANGRHWPQQNALFFNSGRARFTVQQPLGLASSTTYATEIADLNGDSHLDIAVGNDDAPNHVFFGSGDGRFDRSSEFGLVSNLRSLTLADIDGDQDIDILATMRRQPNRIFLNDGAGKFDSGITFGNETDSTIDVAVVDWNSDGHLDLALANRDSQPNCVLINDGKLGFTQRIPFGTGKDNTRAVVVADFNSDKHPDLAVANIGQPNAVFLSDGKGGIGDGIPFGRVGEQTYSLAVADMDADGDMDLVSGNVRNDNAVFFNSGDGKTYREVRFGGKENATYGLAIGDLDADGFPDIVVANSGAINRIFLNRPQRQPQPKQPQPKASPKKPREPKKTDAAKTKPATAMPLRSGDISTDWPSFRGPGATGVADGFSVRENWNVDPENGDIDGVLWQANVPGLGHSSPVIVGDRLFLATAIASSGNAPLKIGRGGKPDAADDQGEQSWVVICYDKNTGKEIWRKVAHKGNPRATRHAKATHANTTIAVAGNKLVAFFGSEGLHCFDLDGNLQWTRDLGVVNISKYGIGWGYASSPAVFQDRISLVCDDPDDPYVATFDLNSGEEIWRTSRQEDCERSWGTPLIYSQHEDGSEAQVVVNGWPWIVSYDLKTGEQRWRVRGGGDNPVPTPFVANGWIYVTNAHGADSPIIVVRPNAKGDITAPESDTDEEVLNSENEKDTPIVWSTMRGGSYMSTPVVYGDHLYLGNTNGVLRCFNAKDGEKVYEKRLGSGASIIASIVAADDKLFCASENGTVYVVAPGHEFELLSENNMGQPCFATPAVSAGVLFIRTTTKLVAIK